MGLSCLFNLPPLLQPGPPPRPTRSLSVSITTHRNTHSEVLKKDSPFLVLQPSPRQLLLTQNQRPGRSC